MIVSMKSFYPTRSWTLKLFYCRKNRFKIFFQSPCNALKKIFTNYSSRPHPDFFLNMPFFVKLLHRCFSDTWSHRCGTVDKSFFKKLHSETGSEQNSKSCLPIVKTFHGSRRTIGLREYLKSLNSLNIFPLQFFFLCHVIIFPISNIKNYFSSKVQLY